MPWNLKEDPLKDYLIHLFTLKVTIAETGEEVQKFVRQVVNSKIKSKVFYDSVGKFIVECVHHMRFQRQRAWTESHRADDVLDWAPFKRMDEQVWLPLLDQLEQEHAEDGFDKPFFLKLMTGDGASKPENWERLVRDWKVCIDHRGIEQVEGLYLAPSEQLRNRTGAHDGPDNPQHEDEGRFGAARRTSLGTDDERMD